jgi:hypothetical protein
VAVSVFVSRLALAFPRSSDWREKYLELELRMEEARKVARQKMLQRIKRASENDWRAAAEWLRLTFPADYRRASNTNLQVNSAVQTGVVITEERRRELIAQRQRILKAIAAKEADGAHEPTGPFLRALNVAHAEGDVIEIDYRFA